MKDLLIIITVILSIYISISLKEWNLCENEKRILD